MNRRQLMVRGALAAAAAHLRAGDAAAAAPGAAPGSVTSPFAREDAGLRWDKAPCRFCGTGCHVDVGVRGGRVVAVAGSAAADVNKGTLCVKGYHVGLALYGPDRLTRPLVRRAGRLQPIGWDEALDLVADRIAAAPDRFAMYGSGQWTIPEGYAAAKLVKAGLGSNHLDANARLCMASAVTGFLAVYGVDEPAGCYADLDACDTLILWGNNPAEMHPVLWSRVVDRRLRGERVEILDIGTRVTRSSRLCDRLLLIQPHGDLALLLGVMHLLVRRGTWDREFVARHAAFKAPSDPPGLHGRSIDFAEFQRLLSPYTPARVSGLCGLPGREIEHLADRFGDRTRRITSLWCMGANQHTQGTAVNTLLHGLHLLSGHFGRPGDAPTSLTGQPSACGTVREVGTLAHALPGGGQVGSEADRRRAAEIWNVPPERIHPKPGYHTLEMWRRFSTPADQGGDIDTLWVQVTNPGQTLPNLHALFHPSRRLPGKFLIVSDVYPTATVRAADLVLPSAMWVEKNGMVGNSERRTQQWFRMVPPPGQARDDAWQILAVARRLYERGLPGLRDRDGRFLFSIERDGREVPVWRWEHYYDVNVDEHLFEEYRRFTRHKHKDLAPYSAYVRAHGLRWPVVEQPDGTWRETRFRFAEFDDPYVERGKGFDFYHSPTKDGRAQIWFHPYVPPPEAPDADYPMWLSTGRVLEHWHSGSMTARVPPLRAAMPNAYVEVHRDDARRLGIRDREPVRIETRRGAITLPAWIDGRAQVQPGHLFVPFFDEKSPINELTLDAHDPFSKQPDYKKCAARLVGLAPPARPGGRRG